MLIDLMGYTHGARDAVLAVHMFICVCIHESYIYVSMSMYIYVYICCICVFLYVGVYGSDGLHTRRPGCGLGGTYVYMYVCA